MRSGDGNPQSAKLAAPFVKEPEFGQILTGSFIKEAVKI
jgi:hypothetical protein